MGDSKGDWSDEEASAPKKVASAASAGDWEDDDLTSGTTSSYNKDASGRGRGGFRGGRGAGAGGGGTDRKPYERRDDDWSCVCGQSNFASRKECYKCHAVKEGGDAGGGGTERKPREPRDGDWSCECGQSNFASRKECFKCHAVKEGGDAGGGGTERKPHELRDGDWSCECGQSNFASRKECFKCHAVKEGGDPEKKDEKPREIYIPPEPSNDETVMFGGGISAGINFNQFDNIDVSVTGKGTDSIKPISAFENAGLREFLVENVKKSGYTKPTPIQKHALPVIMAKRDLMACAQTGSGKTAAFLLPILNAIMNDNVELIPGQPQCLIMAPTRELAIQIFDEARKFAHGSWVKVCIAYGGTASRHQEDKIKSGCHILVATPGRLMDFVNKTIITFQSLRFLVLDEADRMLDMGFRVTIENVASHETVNKDSVQTLMFSATFPADIQDMAAKYLRDYLFLTVGIVGGASTDVAQEIIQLEKKQKRTKLEEILKEYCNDSEEDRILIFVEAKKTADFLASWLSETTMSSTSIHGDRLQREREEALRDFRAGKRKILVATSVAARGLDIKGVTHVINYDLPKDVQDYVHRIGRTGRVGNRGKATSFFDPSKDDGIAAGLAQILQDAKQPVPSFLGDAASSTGGVDAFGGTDIRGGVASGNQQETEDEW